MAKKKADKQVFEEGRTAQTILDDPLFEQVIKEVQAELFDGWRAEREDQDKREQMHSVAIAMDVLLVKLRSKADDLAIARAQQA